jgi:hypothetical protein
MAAARLETAIACDGLNWPGQAWPIWQRAAWRGAKLLLRATKRFRRGPTRDFDPSRLIEEGVLDLAEQRCAMAWTDGPTHVVVGDRLWIGPPGNVFTPGKVLHAESSFPAGDRHPLWLLGLLNGVVDARPRSSDGVRGVPCRGFDVTADLARASAATPGGLAPSCDVARFEDLLALSLTVWLDDDGRVRQVVWDPTGGERGYRLELYDFGIPTVDWTELPE